MYTYWAMMLSVSGMYTMYITEIGFSKKEISIVVTTFILAASAGQNTFGYLADRFRCIKKILLFSISIGIAAAVALNFFREAWFVHIIITIWGFFLYGTVPLSEAWYISVLKANNEQKDFGKIRGVGSIGYGISGIILGLLLQYIGWAVYIWYVIFSGSILLLVIVSMDENKDAVWHNLGGKSNLENNGKISLREVFKQIIKVEPLRTIIMIMFVYTFVLEGIYIYLGVLIPDFGGGPLSLGLTYFFDATPEVITFVLTSRLIGKYKSKYLILVAFLLQIIRFSLILIFKSPVSIILLGILSGSAFGMAAAAYKTYIYENAPAEYRISCLSLSESIIGFSAVLGAPVYGYLIIKYGGYASIAVGLFLFIVMVLFIIINMYIEERS